METCQHRPHEAFLISVANVNRTFFLFYVFGRFNKTAAV